MNKYRLWYNRLMAKAVIREMFDLAPANYEKHYVTALDHGGEAVSANTVK